MTRMWTVLRQAIDLLDVVLCVAFTLITTGCWILWGPGWACLILGVLLLGLVVIGVPAGKRTP